MALKNEFQQQGNFLFKHRSYLPVFIILIGLAVYVWGKLRGMPIAPENIALYELGCIGVSLVGLLIRCYTIGYAAEHTSGRNTSAGQIANSINDTGAYSMLRHPLYLGNFFLWLGIAGFTQNFWFIIAFVLLYWLYYERIMYAEESFLIKTYGEDYLEYSSRTSAFVPRLKDYKAPRYSFSWQKVIRQEKSGILALCVVLFAFKFLGKFLSQQEIMTDKTYWGILIFGLIWYTVTKTLQKTTTLLTSDRD